MTLTKRQQQVVDYLAANPGWNSPTNIGKAVWGPGHHSASASPVCIRLSREGVIERDYSGRYRLPEPRINAEPEWDTSKHGTGPLTFSDESYNDYEGIG